MYATVCKGIVLQNLLVQQCSFKKTFLNKPLDFQLGPNIVDRHLEEKKLSRKLKPSFMSTTSHGVNNDVEQGCQMEYFRTEILIWVNFVGSRKWNGKGKWKMLVYVMAVWSILRPFGIFCGHVVYFMVYFSCFGMLYQEKSGNPGVVESS
jgi:hypothetical protein